MWASSYFNLTQTKNSFYCFIGPKHNQIKMNGSRFTLWQWEEFSRVEFGVHTTGLDLVDLESVYLFRLIKNKLFSYKNHVAVKWVIFAGFNQTFKMYLLFKASLMQFTIHRYLLYWQSYSKMKYIYIRYLFTNLPYIYYYSCSVILIRRFYVWIGINFVYTVITYGVTSAMTFWFIS